MTAEFTAAEMTPEAIMADVARLTGRLAKQSDIISQLDDAVTRCPEYLDDELLTSVAECPASLKQLASKGRLIAVMAAEHADLADLPEVADLAITADLADRLAAELLAKLPDYITADLTDLT